MKRRQMLKHISLAGSLAAVSGAGYLYLTRASRQQDLTLEKMVADLKAIDTTRLVHLGEWSPATIFAHCSQSIAFSVTGYPAHKSEFFKNTIGPLAFNLFASLGKMKHNLAEAIPGAADIEANDSQTALNELIYRLEEFDRYAGNLAPHFAFGDLSKSEYTLAHLMHINNHFDELRTT
jgi:hypothetical protein